MPSREQAAIAATDSLSTRSGLAPERHFSVGVEHDDYGPADIRSVLPAELLAKASIDPGLMTRVDPAGWLAMVRELYPAGDAGIERLTNAEALASSIISQITIRARLGSQLGQSHAVIMSVHPRKDIVQEAGAAATGILAPEQLSGAARIVWDHIVANSVGYPAHCQPTLDFWQGEDYTWSGHNIVIHFNPSTKVERAPLERLGDVAIEQIPKRAMLESLVGRTFASVLSFRDGDDNFIEKDPSQYPAELQGETYRPGNVMPHMLKGPAKQVWDFCEEKGLQPTLEYWETTGSDGHPYSGFEIAIHWFSKDQNTEAEAHLQATGNM